MSNKQHADKTSAEDKSIGFDFQYYYFLNKLLNLQKGETLGLEVMDDVHSEIEGSTQVLVQLKFTIQTQGDGSPKNLTTLDIDFWKTASNWSKVITDKEANRSDKKEQTEFVNRTEFLLASNKSDNERNKILKTVRAFQAGQKTKDDILTEIASLKEQATDTSIAGYIDDVLALGDTLLCAFLRNLRFDLGCEHIIQKCKDSIAKHYIDPSRIDDVFYSLDSQIRCDNFELVRNREKILISYEEFIDKYRIHFDKARNGELIVKRAFEVPENGIGEQLFIRQLVEIGDVGVRDYERIGKLLYHQLLAKNNINDWQQEGYVTSLDVEALEDDAVTNWDNLHRAAFRGTQPTDDTNNIAVTLVDQLRTEKLTIANQEMDRPFSNGEYYDLCEQKKIGWRNDWETKYK